MKGKEGASWDELCHATNEISLEVFGEKALPHPRPWMRGTVRDKDSLDEAVHKAQQRDRQAARMGSAVEKREARKALRKAQTGRRTVLQNGRKSVGKT